MDNKAMSSGSGDLLSKLVGTVRASTALGARDVDFCRSLDRDVADSIHSNAEDMVQMINNVLLSMDPHHEQLEVGKEKLEDSWKEFSNLMDMLLEKSDRCLDTLMKRTSSIQDSRESYQFINEAADKDTTPSVRIVKPQLKFKRAVDNSESHPFMPLITEKPNAIKPLDQCLKLIPDEEGTPEHYCQPYEYEIDHQEYDQSVLLRSDPIPSRPWEGTEGIWIDRPETLKSLVSDLKKYEAIAVDLEHHDYRSYYGIVCLMQISTRDTDYLVDTISLRDDLKILNEVFTDPKILKVFHGAFMDIIWLQRDLGLYVVNLFDTYHASRAIGLPRYSLAFLLEKYSNFKTSKKYQLADWRVRPLSKSMIAYARADTHFLLNIYDQLRNRLVEENKLAGVLFESRNVAKRRFEYMRFRPKIPIASVYSSAERDDAWRSLAYQYNIGQDKQELLKNIFEWRDMIARREDESPRYIMPNQLLVSLVEYGPVDAASVVSVSSIVTDHVRSYSKELANLIRTASEASKKSPYNIREESNYSLTNVDIAETLTFSQIQRKVTGFDTLLRKHKRKSNETSNASSAILFGNILSQDDLVIQYRDGEVIRQSLEQLAGRALAASKKMQSFDESVSISVAFAQPERIDIQAVEDSEDGVREAPLAKGELTEDMDEIVSLRKVKDKKSKANRKSGKGVESNEAIDYNKNEKILKKDHSRDRLSRKRTFDPYSAPNDSPQAPKAARKRAKHRGKSASFR